jgi:hypothetical protein
MTSIETIRAGVAYAQEIFMATAGDLTAESTHWVPPGIANPISALYAHAVIEQDDWIAIAKASPSFYESTFKDKTGISEVRNGITLEWAKSLEVDLVRIKSYAEAVHASTLR